VDGARKKRREKKKGRHKKNIERKQPTKMVDELKGPQNPTRGARERDKRGKHFMSW